MRKTMITLLILLLVWTLPASEAMPAEAVGEIVGSVTNRIPDAEGEHPGIDSVSVCVDHHETHEVIWAEGSTTDADGRYVVRDVPAGRMTVVFQRVGYVDDPTVSDPVQLEPGETRRVDATMQRRHMSQALIIRFTDLRSYYGPGGRRFHTWSRGRVRVMGAPCRGPLSREKSRRPEGAGAAGVEV